MFVWIAVHYAMNWENSVPFRGPSPRLPNGQFTPGMSNFRPMSSGELHITIATLAVNFEEKLLIS